jgi:AcrR family transcriptional regulator
MTHHHHETTGQHQTPLRERLVEAAAKVYGEFGFRGATTRLIAETAGVNEVTLFRTFGSKAALIDEAIRAHADPERGKSLPEVPVDPLHELTSWAENHIDGARRARGLVIKTMGDIGERPGVAPAVCSGMASRHQEIVSYVTELQRLGYATADFEPSAAVAMLLGALFGDAMGREMVPEIYPQPPESAAEQYVRLFLRAIGVAESAAHVSHASAPATPSPRTVSFNGSDS